MIQDADTAIVTLTRLLLSLLQALRKLPARESGWSWFTRAECAHDAHVLRRNQPENDAADDNEIHKALKAIMRC